MDGKVKWKLGKVTNAFSDRCCEIKEIRVGTKTLCLRHHLNDETNVSLHMIDSHTTSYRMFYHICMTTEFRDFFVTARGSGVPASRPRSRKHKKARQDNAMQLQSNTTTKQMQYKVLYEDARFMKDLFCVLMTCGALEEFVIPGSDHFSLRLKVSFILFSITHYPEGYIFHLTYRIF